MPVIVIVPLDSETVSGAKVEPVFPPVFPPDPLNALISRLPPCVNWSALFPVPPYKPSSPKLPTAKRTFAAVTFALVRALSTALDATVKPLLASPVTVIPLSPPSLPSLSS